MAAYKTLRTTERSELVLEYGRLSIKAEKLGLDNNLLQNAPIEKVE